MFVRNNMAKGKNQKLKLLYLAKILKEKTDEENGITMPQLIDELAKYGVDGERKTLYEDLRLLEQFGLEVSADRDGSRTYYHLVGREFEVAELKLLVDAIQASRFITERKSNALIRKLESQLSENQAKLLHREVFVADRIKSMNESIYYGIDAIHNAMNNNHKIKFHYFRWNVEGKQELRHDGAFYQVSPWALTWDNQNYYLIAYDSEWDQLRHYRVDKMKDISELEDEKRDGAKLFADQNKEVYTEKRFKMYNGDIRRVKLKCKNYLANVIVDQFGTKDRMWPLDEESFTINVDVAVSPQFFGWVLALGKDIEIVEPANVVDEMKKYLDEIRALY